MKKKTKFGHAKYLKSDNCYRQVNLFIFNVVRKLQNILMKELQSKRLCQFYK